MSEIEKRIWGIHTQDDTLFLKDNTIAIGWGAFGDLTNMENSREAFKKKYAETYPQDKKGAIALAAGMLYRFRFEMQIGDYVVFPSKSNREVNIGIVDGEYQYKAEAQGAAGEYVNRRKVKWLKHLPRTYFSQGALYETGSAMSLFTIKNYADEFLAALDTGFKKTAMEDEDESVGATAEEIKQSTKDFILKELSRNLKGYALESFVADLLNAMGYRTELSPQGGDSGIDITAYKDELPPRILVQVKSQDGDIRETTIQSLKGAMREGDYGLFISLSGYTKNAKKYLDSTPIIRGIDGDELATLVLKYYENLSPKYKKVIPLERVYIPVPAEE